MYREYVCYFLQKLKGKRKNWRDSNMHAWTQMMWPLAFEQAKLWGPRVVHATISESINFRILTYIYDRYLALYIIYLFICMRKQVLKGASSVWKRLLIYLWDSHQHLPSPKPLIPNLYPYICMVFYVQEHAEQYYWNTFRLGFRYIN